MSEQTVQEEAVREVSVTVELVAKVSAEFVTDEQMDAYVSREANAIRSAVETAANAAAQGVDMVEAGWVDDDHEAFLVEIRDACATDDRVEVVA